MSRLCLFVVACCLIGPLPARGVPPVVKWSSDAAHWAPDLLQVLDRRSDRRKVRVRVYADSQYRANIPRWQERARALFDDLNILAGPTFGVRFEVESLRRWEDPTAGMSADALLGLLETKDPGQDVDWVVGFIPALPLVSTSMHELGTARILGRHFVMRAMADVEEARAIKSLGLSKDEEDKLYTARKWHKELALFLHEWGHTLGAIHSSNPTSLMNTHHSHKVVSFSGEQLTAMDLALGCRLGTPPRPAFNCPPLFAYLEKTSPADWFAKDRQRALELLSDGLKGRGLDGTPQTSNPDLTPQQVRSWNGVLSRVDDARDAQENGDPAAAMKTLARATEDAHALSPEGGARAWLAIARRYQALGAISLAEIAVAGAGTEPGAAAARAELRRAGRTYGLPAKGITPENEPAYIRTFEGLAKGLNRSSGGAVAKALETYPQAPGLLMLECDVHLKAGRARQAEKSCNSALEGAPELARAHYLVGRLDADRGLADEAMTHLRKAVELDPLSGQHWSTLSAFYRTRGKAKELQELAEEYEKRFKQKLP
jgi:tetratricopeptide (TPR) repeat protein